MLKIALTGGIGSGKSTVAKYFVELGVPVIDADEVSRELVTIDTSPYAKIVSHFGSKILNADKTLNRKTLRKIIFNKPADKKWLENLLHPLIYQAIDRQIKTIQAPYCIVVIPLLFETKREKNFDRVLVINAPKKQRLTRVIARDKISLQQAKAILTSQIDRDERLAQADDVIYNGGTLAELKHQVARYINTLQQLGIRL